MFISALICVDFHVDSRRLESRLTRIQFEGKHFNNYKIKKREREMEEKNFVCPVCGGTKYREFSHNIMTSQYTPFEVPGHVPYYECCDCSVMFGDPRKFTLKKEDLQYIIIKFDDPKNGRNALYPYDIEEWMELPDGTFIVSPKRIKALKVFGVSFEEKGKVVGDYYK